MLARDFMVLLETIIIRTTATNGADVTVLLKNQLPLACGQRHSRRLLWANVEIYELVSLTALDDTEKTLLTLKLTHTAEWISIGETPVFFYSLAQLFTSKNRPGYPVADRPQYLKY
jgi:hypothetical protein